MQRNHLQRSARGALACLAALVAAGAFLANPASAAPEAPSGTAEGTTRPTATPPAQVDDLDAHWTAERVAAAEAPDMGETAVDPDATSAPDPGPERIAEPTVPEAEFGASQVDHSYATGRLFFDYPDGDPGWCSASSIASDNESLVLTAGHCLHDGGGTEEGWFTNVRYVPGYDHGDEPRGSWDGIFRTHTVFETWYDEEDEYDDGGNIERDVGMILVSPNDSGENLTEVTAGHGFATGQGYDHDDMHVIGYPENHEENEVQWHCWGASEGVDWFNSMIEIECGMNEGASGGPWLLEYSDDIAGLGLANGTTSQITNDGEWNWSSYFDDSTWDFYQEMSTLST